MVKENKNKHKNRHRNKLKILVTDDSKFNRDLLNIMLEDEYDIIEAENGIKATNILRKMNAEISLVLLDVVMPEMDGFGVLEIMNKYRWIDDIPVMMITAETDPGMLTRAYDLGVTDFIRRPFDTLVVQRRVQNTVRLYEKQNRLIGMVTNQLAEREKQSTMMVDILSNIVEFRNGESGLHVLHVRTITRLLLNKLLEITNRYPLSKRDVSLITTASALHDIGKIAIPSEILNKPGRFTDEEFAIMKTHSMHGAQMIDSLATYKDEPLVKYAYEICRWHHERWGGRGYPDGLAGDDIPVSAQIVALADVYDALTSERCYKKAYTHREAIRMILNSECGEFNPLLMECLRAIAGTLQGELMVQTSYDNGLEELRLITKEMMGNEDLAVTERNLRLLEDERTKFDFLLSITGELLFEYSLEPPMLIVSKACAKKLGMKERVLVNFGPNEGFEGKWRQRLLEEILAAMEKTTPKDPRAELDWELLVEGKKQRCRFILNAMWHQGDPPKCTGVIGKICF